MQLVRRFGSVTLALAVFGAVIAVGPISARPAQANSATVDIKDLAFGPTSITVAQGDTVTWTNDEEIMPHDVTSGTAGAPDLGQMFGSELLTPGQTFSVTFSDAGEFVYLCKLHPNMTGVVVVQAAS